MEFINITSRQQIIGALPTDGSQKSAHILGPRSSGILSSGVRLPATSAPNGQAYAKRVSIESGGHPVAISIFNLAARVPKTSVALESLCH